MARTGTDYELIEADYAMSAEMSPTKKVPYLIDGDLMLTDSSSILKYVREKSGQPFLADIDDFELFVMTNTLMDAAMNVFLLEKGGVSIDEVEYLAKQNKRVEDGLKVLDQRFDPNQGIGTDSALRCACFIDWALFRKRISLDGLDRLQALLDKANLDSEFATTAPPR